jgi:hypothetical protein
MLEPAELLRDPKFKTPYFKALGPKAKLPWLATVDGTPYVLAAELPKLWRREWRQQR